MAFETLLTSPCLYYAVLAESANLYNYQYSRSQIELILKHKDKTFKNLYKSGQTGCSIFLRKSSIRDFL